MAKVWKHTGHDDDDEWRSWHVEDPELDSFEEWDEDDGPLTPKNLSNR